MAYVPVDISALLNAIVPVLMTVVVMFLMIWLIKAFVGK